MLFAKIFRQIYDGTLANDWKALVTFQQLLILSDWHGIVDMTPQAISRATGIPPEIIQEGIQTLSQPDQYSRSREQEGRRIVLIDASRPWGWQIVNYAYYLSLASATEKREKDRSRIAILRSEDRSGMIYFIGSKNSNKIKIGFSKNPWARLSELQTGNPERLSVVATIKTTERSELTVSRLFVADLIEGEWYRWTKEIDNLIKNLKDKRLETSDDVVDFVVRSRSVVANVAHIDLDLDKDLKNGKKQGIVKGDLSDTEWLLSLEKSPAYQGIDVTREYHKCLEHFKLKKIVVSRRRFLNWLNKVDKPMGIQGDQKPKPSTVKSHEYFKPEKSDGPPATIDQIKELTEPIKRL